MAPAAGWAPLRLGRYATLALAALCAATGCTCSSVDGMDGGGADGGGRDGSIDGGGDGSVDASLDSSTDAPPADGGGDGPDYGHAITVGGCETVWAVYGSEGGEHFGSQLLRLGDLDGDGVPDLAVSSQPGFGAHVSFTLLSGRTGGEIRRFEVPAQQVHSLTRGGDLDGDATADFAFVGSEDLPAMTTDGGFSTGGGTQTGAWAYSGGSGAQIWERTDIGTSNLGMGPVSDANGDGVADFLLGNTTLSAMGGQVQVISGADGAVLETIPAPSASLLFGQGGLELGDVNGDEVADLVITDGLGPSTHLGGGSVFAISGSDRTILWSAIGEVTGTDPTFLGNIVAPEGVDLNADGIPDLLTSEHNRAEGGLAEAGRVVAMDGATGARLWETPGTRSGEHFGSKLAFVGDLDGDGVSDVLASGPATFAAMLALGGTGRAAVLSSVDGSVIAEVFGVASESEPSDGLGAGLDGFRADVDGDGQLDFALGVPNADRPGRDDVGAVLVLSCAP